MARAGRQQRRAQRRAKQGEEQPQQKQKPAPRRSRGQQVRPGAQPQKLQTGRPGAQQRGRFVRESWGELKKVDWPGRGQVMQGTVVVLIACAIVGAYLWVADLAWRNFVERVLL
jgi:preprotein translocase SecE subunit